MIRSSRTHRLIGLRNIDRKRWHCLRPYKRPGSIVCSQCYVRISSISPVLFATCPSCPCILGHLIFVVDHPSVEQNDDFFCWRLPFPSKWHPFFFTLWLFSVSSVWPSFENLPAPPWFSPKHGANFCFLQRKQLFSHWFVDDFVKQRGTRAMLPEPLHLPEMWTRMGARLGARSELVPKMGGFQLG